MKKHFLFLATLVLGLGQLFADNVTFDASTLWKALGGSGSQAQSVTTPYTWKTSPYYVTVTLDGSGTTQNVNTAYIPFAKGKSFTVSGTTGTTISKITFTLQQTGQKDNVGANTGSYSNLAWTPEEGTAPSSVTFTTTNAFQVKTISVEYTPGEAPDVPGADGFTEPFEATPVDSKASYTGNDPYIYDKSSLKFYALNTNGEYEEYGVVSEVNTLKVAGDAVTEIESIKSTNNAYINLNYIPKANSKAICTINAETGGDWKAIYGCGYFENGWKDRFCFFTTNATINLG